MLNTAVAWAQIITAVAAFGAVFIALWQARISADAVREQNQAGKDQQQLMNENLKVELLLRYEGRFESPAMMMLRRTLATRLLSSGTFKQRAVMPDSIYEVCGDEIPGFFESLATMHSRRHIDTELAWGDFDYWARHYWAALHSFVTKDRTENGEDMWQGFEALVQGFERYGGKHGSRKPIDDAAVEKSSNKNNRLVIRPVTHAENASVVRFEYLHRLRDGLRHAALKGVRPDRRRSRMNERGPFD